MKDRKRPGKTRTAAPATMSGGRRYPIEPRWAIERSYAAPDGARQVVDLVICRNCEGFWTGRWHETGEPIYSGGAREVVIFDDKAPGGYRQAFADCSCPVGIATGRPNLTEDEDRYPSSAAIQNFYVTGEDPRTFRDQRTIRPVTQDDLERWRRRWHLPNPFEPSPEEKRTEQQISILLVF